MPSDYLDTTPPREVVWHLDEVLSLEAPGHVSVDARHADRVLVAGADREGFLLAVSQAFTRNGIGVMDARLRTRSDGLALDIYHVADDLTRALDDEDSLRDAIDERVRTYRRHDEDRSPVEVGGPRTTGCGCNVEGRRCWPVSPV